MSTQQQNQIRQVREAIKRCDQMMKDAQQKKDSTAYASLEVQRSTLQFKLENAERGVYLATAE